MNCLQFFLYIIFAVLLKFERSLISYFVHNNNYYYHLPATSLQNFIYLRQSAAEILLFVQKSKIAAAAILNFIFVQYFGISVRKTSNVIHMPNFVQICAIVNELWATDEIQNGGRRHLKFIIFVHFVRSNGLSSVAAGSITAKFHSSMSIGGRDIAVCAKIQDDGRRHLEFNFCLIFWHTAWRTSSVIRMTHIVQICAIVNEL